MIQQENSWPMKCLLKSLIGTVKIKIFLKNSAKLDSVFKTHMVSVAKVWQNYRVRPCLIGSILASGSSVSD